MTQTLPLFPLRTVLCPGGVLPLRIFEPRYVAMVRRCMRENMPFVVVQLFDGSEAGAGRVSMAGVGTQARIVDFDRLDDGLLGLTCVGERRVRLGNSVQQADGLHVGDIELLEDDPTVAVPAECVHLVEILRHFWQELPEDYTRWLTPRFDSAGWVANRLCELSPFEPVTRQGLLEMADPLQRLRYLAPLVHFDGQRAN